MVFQIACLQMPPACPQLCRQAPFVAYFIFALFLLPWNQLWTVQTLLVLLCFHLNSCPKTNGFLCTNLGYTALNVVASLVYGKYLHKGQFIFRCWLNADLTNLGLYEPIWYSHLIIIIMHANCCFTHCLVPCHKVDARGDSMLMCLILSWCFV